MSNIEKMLDALIAREGGYVNDPRDTGGETIWGITAHVARANGYTGAMRLMSREAAKAIYRSQYFIRPGFDRLEKVSAAIAEKLFDAGVNMGPAKASEFLQRALNALNNQARDYPDIKIDSEIGPASIGALKSFLNKRGGDGESVMLKALNCLQGARYIELAEGRAANEGFLFGWLRARIA